MNNSRFVNGVELAVMRLVRIYHRRLRCGQSLAKAPNRCGRVAPPPPCRRDEFGHMRAGRAGYCDTKRIQYEGLRRRYGVQ